LTVTHTDDPSQGKITLSYFFGPTGNGYFSVWAGALASLLGLGLGIDQLKAVATRDRVSSLGALLAAAVLLVDVGPEVGHDKPYQSEVVYGLVVSVLVLLVLLTVLAFDHSNLISPKPMPLEVKRVAYAISALLWLGAAIALTFYGPFQGTGNGYFASWGGSIALVLLTVEAFQAVPSDQTSGGEAGGAGDSSGGVPDAVTVVVEPHTGDSDADAGKLT